MRGGRNKFGPMYKYDRALRQQALRQRQLLLAQGGYHHDDPRDHQHPDMSTDLLAHVPCGTPPDVKPDISQLSVISRVPHHEPVANVSSSLAEFYRGCGVGSDPVRTVMSSGSVGGSFPPVPPPQPPPASRLCPPYPPPPSLPAPPRQYSSSMSSYSCESAVNTPHFSGGGSVTDTPMSRLTPLAGLSHMMNDVSNFVGQSYADSRLQRVYPPAGVRSSRTSTNLPVYQLPVIRPPEEVRRPPSMVQPSSVPAGLPQSSPLYPHHNPLASPSSSQVTGLTHNEVDTDIYTYVGRLVIVFVAYQLQISLHMLVTLLLCIISHLYARSFSSTS